MSGPTREQVMAWAQHVGMAGMITDVVTTIDELERFAAIAFAAGQATEREACANVCENVSEHNSDRDGKTELVYQCAAAIRARGQQ